MRSTLRLFAAVKPGRYLEPGVPTGLTGLLTHPAPRSRLLYLYSSILEKLKALPESSVYRQSTEAVTKHRMSIIEQIKPQGFDEWEKRAVEKMKNNPEMFSSKNSNYGGRKVGDKFFVAARELPDNDDLDELEWDGDQGRPTMEGTKSEKGARFNARELRRRVPSQDDLVDWKPEPALEATQISEAETQIGAGLIEEVIQVAEGEIQLVDTMIENKVWEELEEKPPAGQWDYFARDQHTKPTQAPADK